MRPKPNRKIMLVGSFMLAIDLSLIFLYFLSLWETKNMFLILFGVAYAIKIVLFNMLKSEARKNYLVVKKENISS